MTLSINQRYWLLVVALGVLGSAALFIYGMPYAGDLPHHYRLALGFYDSIKSGDFYPSWLPATNAGYGDPSVRFYPPALYYLLCFFRLVTHDWYFASLATFSSLNIVAAAGIFLWASALTERQYAVVAAIVFILSPFHANELYQSSMLAQYAGASVLPFIFGFAERIISARRWRDAGGLSISAALLILFHLPLAVLGSVAVCIYVLIRLAQSFSLRAFLQLAAGGVTGMALSCGYWLPMLLELKWKQPSGVGQDKWFDYRYNFIFRPSLNEMGDWWIPIIVTTTLLMAVPAIVLVFRPRRQALAPAVVALLTFFMATPLSQPIWDRIPPLQETQFPWRWLTITSACLAVLVALSLPTMMGIWRSPRRPLALALLGISVIALSFTILQGIRGGRFQRRSGFNQLVASLKESPTNKDFLPIWASGKLPTMDQPVEATGRTVQVNQWWPQAKEIQLGAGAANEIRVRLLYYPHWRATASGIQLPTRPAADGALIVGVPPTASTITVGFVEPRTTYIAGVISLLGLIATALLLVPSFQKKTRA
jgi:uncharacterized membrane protein